MKKKLQPQDLFIIVVCIAGVSIMVAAGIASLLKCIFYNISI